MKPRLSLSGTMNGAAKRVPRSVYRAGRAGILLIPYCIPLYWFILCSLLILPGGCFRYSFTGVSIPSDVRTIHIPFFPDQSGSGMGDLSDQLNEAVINRFVNQTRLQLTDSPEFADVILRGSITSYSNRPFSIGGDQRAQLNRVQITVRASYQFTRNDAPEWDKSFSGNFEYDPGEDPVDGENTAAFEALSRIADNMFNDAMSRW